MSYREKFLKRYKNAKEKIEKDNERQYLNNAGLNLKEVHTNLKKMDSKTIIKNFDLIAKA